MKEDNSPYMPSNGTDGEGFISTWCETCSKDTGIRGGKTHCPILGKSLRGEQPKQWVYIADNPTCISYKDYQIKVPVKYHRPKKNQPQLF
jgi:hypothetical protein